jgi:hypothetical protein
MADVLERLKVALTDRYTIDRELGSGGMATVYLAEDMKHHRQVALKVLRPELAAVLGAERFVQEITTTANLQHPHILPLFDSGEAEGFLYYVMPFIDGETLRDKLNRETQLGIEEAVKITTEVADALDYAHRHNVIHRDIKPENILLHDGRPMVADFGIALAVSAAAGGRMTETGLSLGTPHYMSPEQATAEKDLTNRSDIYSLGAVLYEMLTGSPPHVGSSAQQIIMKIVTDEPRPVTELRKTVPPNVAAAVAKALEKLPADRFGSAQAFGDALSTSHVLGTVPGVAPAEAAVAGRRGPLTFVPYAIVLAAGALLGFLAAPRGNEGPATYDIGLPDSAQLAFAKGDPFGTGWTAFAVAPDGDFVVYIADVDTTTLLWYRSLVDDAMRPIPGTEGAYQLFLSPDGREVAFLSGDRLRKVALDQAGVFNVAQVDRPYGGHWLPDGRLMLADSNGGTLNDIDVNTGGMSSIRVRSGGANWACQIPYAVPSNDVVLCTEGTFGLTVAMRLSNGEAQRVRYQSSLGAANANAPVLGSTPQLVDNRYLLYLSPEGYLYGAPFDLQTLTLGRSVVVLRGLRREGLAGAGQYAVTASGTLVYVPGGNNAAGHLVKTRGTAPPEMLPIPLATVVQFDIKRDQTAMAVVVQAVAGQELWTYDLRTGNRERLLSGFFIQEPRWSPAGDRLLFQLQPQYEDSLMTIAIDPRFPTQIDTLHGVNLMASQYFNDDAVVGITAIDTSFGIVVIDPTVIPSTIDTLRFTDGEPTRPALSPDGRWMAYMLIGSGRDGVYIERYPRSGPRYKVSIEGGLDPLWLSPTELSYRAGSVWYKARVSNDGPEQPRVWFDDPQFIDTWLRSQVQTSDGGMIYLRGTGVNTASYFRVVPNWAQQMKAVVDEANR